MREINLESLNFRSIEEIEKEININGNLFIQACEKNDLLEIMLYEHNVSVLRTLFFNNKKTVAEIQKECLLYGYSVEINDGLISGIYRNDSYENMWKNVKSC